MHIQKKHWLFLLLLWGICVFDIIPNRGQYMMYDYVCGKLGLGNVQISSGGMYLLVEALFPIIIIELVEGISIYKHYTDGSVYYFVRQKNFEKWYKNEALRLFIVIFEIVFIYMLGGMIIGWVINGQMPTVSSVLALMCQCAMFTLYAYAFSLLINCIAIIGGSDMAYVINVGIQLIFVLLLMVFEKNAVTKDNIWILRWNPITCITIMWHYIPYESNSGNNHLGVGFDALASCIYLACICIVLFNVVRKILANRDIAMENKEEQG